jgi:hypothetical protein
MCAGTCSSFGMSRSASSWFTTLMPQSEVSWHRARAKTLGQHSRHPLAASWAIARQGSASRPARVRRLPLSGKVAEFTDAHAHHDLLRLGGGQGTFSDRSVPKVRNGREGCSGRVGVRRSRSTRRMFVGGSRTRSGSVAHATDPAELPKHQRDPDPPGRTKRLSDYAEQDSGRRCVVSRHVSASPAPPAVPSAAANRWPAPVRHRTRHRPAHRLGVVRRCPATAR